jgi:hypothetical protein
MRDWNSTADRGKATIAFADFMNRPGNETLRRTCCDDPTEAKRQFGIIGEFYLEGETIPGQPPNTNNLTPIPKSVQFKVYDATDPLRQDLVVLVLPSVTGQRSDEATDIWIAAWPPWVSFHGVRDAHGS